MKDYLFSGWIENLGVVPLFLLAAFLLAPALTLLFFLILLVTCVLDAMTYPSQFNSYLTKNRLKYLSLAVLFVKMFFLNSSNLASASKGSQIFLSKGEQTVIKFQGLTRFSIGNKQVLKVTHGPKKNRLLIKGDMIGFSDLILWHGTKKSHYSIFVLSKREQLKRMSTLSDLKSTGLEVSTTGAITYIKGEITTYLSYLTIQKFVQHDKNIVTDISVHRILKRKILMDIYSQLYPKGTSFINCYFQQLKINCSYDGPLDKASTQNLKSRYLINFSSLKANDQDNLLIEYKIIQVDFLNSEVNTLGLSQITTKLSQIINQSASLDSNVLMQSTDMKASIIAEPKVITTLNQQSSLELGSTIPYTKEGKEGPQIFWQFAGLKVNSTLKIKNSKVMLSYNTEFSRPMGEAISGTKGKGFFYITSDEYTPFFQIGYNTSQEITKGIPILKDIYLLSSLFSSKSKGSTYKQIIAFARLSKGEINGN